MLHWTYIFKLVLLFYLDIYQGVEFLDQSAEGLVVSNYGAEEGSWESGGQQGDQTSQSKRKSTLNIHWKDWCWSWSSNTLATWCEEQTHWKRAWCWERLRAGEGDDGGWNGWIASLTQWTWVWTNSGREWRTGRPGVPVESVESQRVRHDLATEWQPW